jgi:Flp pilus assembly protein TadG
MRTVSYLAKVCAADAPLAVRGVAADAVRELFSRRPRRCPAIVVLGQRGVAALEFALLVPVLVLLVFGGIQFGLTLNTYITLTSAARAGARQFALSRGDATPLTDTLNEIYSAAPNLSQASLTVSLLVNGTACTTDASCSAALVSGVPATVDASYPCRLVIGGINFAPGCTLYSDTTERVE